MLAIFPLTMFVLMNLLPVVESGYYSKSRKLSWSQENPLTWESFKKFPDLFDSYEAAIFCNVEYRVVEDSLNSIMIEAFAYPFKSYVLMASLRSQELLKHERYHFNITELFARKFEQIISRTCANLSPATII